MSVIQGLTMVKFIKIFMINIAILSPILDVGGSVIAYTLRLTITVLKGRNASIK